MRIIHHHFKSLDSTNNKGKELLKKLSNEYFVTVTADTQTQGRGQYGRSWISPKGQNIYVSFCFFIKKTDKKAIDFVTLLADTTLLILKKQGVECEKKWPNDLMIEGKKLAGILSETFDKERDTGVIIGLGLNVNTSQEDLLLIDQPATSLLVETHKRWDSTLLITQIQEAFLKAINSDLPYQG